MSRSAIRKTAKHPNSQFNIAERTTKWDRRQTPCKKNGRDVRRLARGEPTESSYWMGVAAAGIGFTIGRTVSKKIVPRVSVAKYRVPVAPGVEGSALPWNAVSGVLPLQADAAGNAVPPDAASATE